ncbi:MAG TPA: glycosyltransferase family 39 protein [Pyrinomonadaceae bacterium]|nr:glycosyltransferase family 39 protein [Pyrinomonadaceae bacterium]
MKRSTQTRGGAWGAILLSWGVVLIFAFLKYRDTDVWRLPSLASSFFQSLSITALFNLKGLAASVAGAGIAALIAFSWYGLGDLIVRLAQKRRSPEVDEDDREEQGSSRIFNVARACALGAGAWSLLWFFLGALKLYRRPLALVTTLLGLALFVMAYRRHQGARPKTESMDAPGRVAFSLCILTGALALIAALAPPTAKDTLLYHISLPKIFIAAGGLTDVPYNIASFLPLGAELHSVWAMLLGQFVSERAAEAASGATQFAFFPLLVAFVYGWAKRQGLDRTWSCLAALLIASVPTIYYVAANGYIDLSLSLYVALAVEAVARWWKTLRSEQLIYAALALSFALCLKLTAIFVVLPLALVILLRARQAQEDEQEHKSAGRERRASAGRIALGGLGALVLACVLASPWYIRTWAQTGSPVFPFYLNIWKGSAQGWDTERSLLFQEINSRYGGYPKNAFSYLAAPVRLSLMGQPDLPDFYDGVLGVAFLFGLPLIVWAWWRLGLDVELKIAAMVSAVLFIFWLFSSQQMRYLLPALPALAVTVAASGALIAGRQGRAIGKALQWMLIAVALAGILTGLAWFMEQNPLRVVLGGEARSNYLARRLDYYPYYEIINRELPPTSRVWLINMRRDTYNIERPFFSDYMFEDYTIRNFVEESRTGREVLARAHAAGITHLLVRQDVLLDYAQSPIVDDRRSRAENLEKMKILQDFLTEGTRVIRRDARFILIELPR